ncbi:hypothetical protein P691DRAFT_788768 [Macrolepiota fuliginosa MF-IS2]|uniref:Uncharacterized protein n=1 Tax=Macrolepiota fuliginosa MF-IS2 TaxID=1400762 RepID=A0A9P5XRB9_9AGAR|nr:hypothetical protein P691DRAFT_788768 [Macrolepiota fuliginosa MF-IS2]
MSLPSSVPSKPGEDLKSHKNLASGVSSLCRSTDTRAPPGTAFGLIGYRPWSDPHQRRRYRNNWNGLVSLGPVHNFNRAPGKEQQRSSAAPRCQKVVGVSNVWGSYDSASSHADRSGDRPVLSALRGFPVVGSPISRTFAASLDVSDVFNNVQGVCHTGAWRRSQAGCFTITLGSWSQSEVWYRRGVLKGESKGADGHLQVVTENVP